MKEISKKEIKKEENNLPIKTYTPEEAKKTIFDGIKFEGDLDYELKKFTDDILPKIINGNEKEEKEGRERMLKNVLPILYALDSETQWALIGTFNSEYRGLAKETTRQIIKDYHCSNSVEKALAEVIANAYIRIIDNSRRLNNELGGAGQTITENKTKYLAMLSKQTDRANRQFLNSLMVLKQIKAPLIEMNIKTTNAFIAQNQQINVDKKINEAK